MKKKNNNPVRKIKAIETMYGNTFFRSRLEARWAVLFDELGIEWLYEYEAFNLSDGSNYLPDFYFPKYDFYAEVKPTDEFKDSRWEFFGKDIKKHLFILSGKPYMRTFNYYDEDGFRDDGVPFADIVINKHGYNIYYGYFDHKYIHNDVKIEQAEIKANSHRFGY